ncbi:MAG TPA: helix-turn-helix transcriptional regulator [Pyrinomonadaceae bacterium]|nr:helix-turn-helix transcriptional regulator [Pyrinomonadaceae bacterium]
MLQIRLALELSQDGMLQQLGLGEKLSRTTVSAYEVGTSEPPLPVLLEYARAGGVWVDVLIDDELDLPDKLPSPTKHEGIRRKADTRSNKG